MKFSKTLIIFLFLICSNAIFSQPGWFKVNSGTGIELNGISSYGQNAWAVGNNGIILRSTNGGLNWVAQPSGTTNNLNYILFRGDSIGYIAGNSGTILRSLNSGNNWVVLNSGSTADLRAIWPLFDTLTVIAVGNNGTILKSINRGQTWVQRTSPVSVNLNNLISGFPMDLFIVGDQGKILYSMDLGDTWTQNSSGTSNNLRSLSVINLWNFTSIVHAVGDNGTIIKTTNSGNNWIAITSGTSQNLRSINATHIAGDTMLYFIAVGETGAMIESINGDVWSNKNLPYSDNLNRIEMQNMNTGYACGINGTIIKSVGNYFFADSRKLDANTISAFFRNDGGFNNDKASNLPGFEWPKGSGNHARFASGLLIGANVNGESRVTTSGYENEYYPGYTTNSIPSGRNDTNYRIYKLNHNSGSPDRQKWPNTLLGNSDQGAPVYFDTASNTWKALDFGSQTMFYSYTDSYAESHTNSFLGGGTQPLKADIKQLNFSLDVSGALGNVVFSQYTIINRSNDLWSNTYITIWSDDDVGDATDDKIACDSALSMGYTYNADNNDPIYGSAPPALGFVLLRGAYTFTGNNNDTVRFCRNKSNMVLNGYRDMGMNVFNFTINGNQQYHDPDDFTQTFNLMRGLYVDGSYIHHPLGYITTLAYSGNPVSGLGWLAVNPADYRIYISTGPVNINPGDTQVIITAQVIARGTTTLNSVAALRSYVNDIRQFYNSCYTSTPIGINNQSGVVKNFRLGQNYPNPFNPVTRIVYDIKIDSKVSIKVYDIIGREVFVFNEFKKSGSYEVAFDGSELASGIYFYSLEAITPTGIFKDTKRMVLVK
ncbi:MAG: YCF48-related protein [Ignavibacteria bacterium]